MKTDVRILLVGEDGVGKTSLILSLISEEFPEQVPAMADEIIIPADVTPERVPTQIVDYSSRVQNEEQLVVEIKKANVICIVYSVDDIDSISKISSYWIPVIHESLSDKVYKPIVLVGNKSDIMETSSMELIMPIMNSFAEIETCVECSAKTLKNISEVFYYAQKAVLHPTAPLYVPESKELTVKCKQALTRIFKICDKDNDGLLNDEEIYIFQRRCFNVPLQPQALEDVKAVVRRHTQDGVHQECLTQKGFLFLHTLFIQRGRHETTWAVLRKFGYNDDLNLNDDFQWPQLKVYSGSSTELTVQGLQFLSDLFEKYDEDHDNCLSPTEITNLFGMCPNTVWNNDVVNSVCTNAHGWITHQGYLSYWMLQTHENVSKTLEFLAYSGYIYEHDSLTNSIYVTRDKRLDIEKKQTNRNVFKCHVFGSKGSGKTSFLQGLLNRSLHYLKTLNCEKLPTTVVNMIPVCGQEKYLVMKEIHSDVNHNNFSCDIICLVYDTSNPNSFEHIAKIFLQYLSTCWIPVCIIGCKADHLEVPQNYILQPADFCIKNGLDPPLMISCTDRINRNVYIQLATMAAYPHMHKSIRTSNINVWLKRGLLITATIGLGYILLSFARKCNR